MENITISCFLGRKNAFPSVFEAEREENMLQVRLELTTSASPAHILLYKYRALTDCATGASAMTSLYEATSIDFFSYICRSEMFLIIKATEMCKFSRILPFPLAIYRQHEVQFLYVSPRHVASMLLGSSCLEHTMRPQIASFSC